MDTSGRKTRDPRLDVIRLTALFFVCATHFFLHSGYTEAPLQGPRMIIMTVFKSLFIVCVPLFITLTGYLMHEKKLTGRYFKGLIRVMVVYLVCSAVYTVYARWIAHEAAYDGSLLHLLKMFAGKLLGFSGTPYAWYIEMYIGLFLLIPFINLGLEKLDTRRKGTVLLVILFILTGLPNLLNVFSFESAEVWAHPRQITGYAQLVPDWWTGIYPIFYYCLGWYLKKYPVRPNLALHISLTSAAVVLDAAFNIYKSDGGPFFSAAWNWDYDSAFMMVTTVLLFSLLLRIPLRPASWKGAYALKLLSDSVLGAYLLSVIFDRIVYARLNAAVPVVTDRFLYAPLTVTVVFLCSMAVSIVITLLLRGARISR